MMFVLHEFWKPAACSRVRAAMERGRATIAEVYADGYRVDQNARRAFDVDVDPDTIEEVQRDIDVVRPQVAQFFGIALSGEEGPGFLRYEHGGFYRRHCDIAADLNDSFPRRISIVVFLTSAGCGCEGGSLRLYTPETLDIAPRAGMLVAFPSDIPHEVLPVTSGVRDAIVDWFY
jgi:predicted 2-oxoglutarate/Fe(II)-dependent dioxygenase YbiX